MTRAMIKEPTSTDRATIIAGPDQETKEHPPRLIVVGGMYLGHQLELGDLPVVVGRSADCTLSLPHASVSRMHCRIWREGESYYIEDLGSTNKTFLNGQAVMRAELRDGDQISVGNHSLKFFRGASVEARYHQELIDLAVYDSLTGFFNRRHFRALLDEEVVRARAGMPLAALIIDLDHFKRINDTHGHLVGDQVLSVVSGLIRSMAGSRMHLGRLGGEEFAVAMAEANQLAAANFAERIRSAIEQHRFEVRGLLVPLSASVGGAMWGRDMLSSADLLRLADERLYQAKAQGRNRVVMQHGA